MKSERDASRYRRMRILAGIEEDMYKDKLTPRKEYARVLADVMDDGKEVVDGAFKADLPEARTIKLKKPSWFQRMLKRLSRI
jgi:hypothetical protein